MYGNPYQMYGANPYGMNQYTPQQHVLRVNGQNGANALTIPPNSSVLALDETAPIVWLCVTDGAGYKTVTPYSIQEYKPQAAPSIQELSDRISKLEARINESDTGRSEKPQNALRTAAEPSAATIPNVQ